MMNANDLMVSKAMEGGNTVDPGSLVNDVDMLRQLADLKHLALPNARILYGSEARKFFDIVTGVSENGDHTAVLVCSWEGSTKLLRKEVNACPLAATRALVDGLHKDTGLLFEKYDVGDQIYGQQGYREHGGRFKLDEFRGAIRDEGPMDDTRTLHKKYCDREILKGPNGYNGNKRGRFEY